MGTATAEFRKSRSQLLLDRAADIERNPEWHRVGIISLTDEGFQYCPLRPWDTRGATDGPTVERWSPNTVDVAAIDTRWHTTRAEANRVRIERVKSCGVRTISRNCEECGVITDAPIRCRHHLLCLHCRQTRMTEYQQRFKLAHTATVRNNQKAGLHRQLHRHGYRWSPRFITLTLPHTGDITRDMPQLVAAWPKFLQRMKEHHIKDRFYPHERNAECTARECERCDNARALWTSVKYVRVLEVTPGGNGMETDPELRAAQGHAHMHLYMYGPYIDRDLVAHYWGRSMDDAYREMLPKLTVDETLAKIDDTKRVERLRPMLKKNRGRYSRPLDEVLRPVVDVRACKGSPSDIARELAKYLVKDGERDAAGDLVHVDPEWFAIAYAALSVRRTIAASRYFWLLVQREPRSCACAECGGLHITTSFHGPQEARGPPRERVPE